TANWLYGGDKATLVQTVTNGRGGEMPAWSTRLEDTTIKQLAIYVHNLGGGK
ncbi:cytochrome C oxidase Cbb3, partial [bacterium]|nr:cytochrome C oxidase Cbb3 [bacterium]